MFSCDHTLVELLLAHQLVRPLLDESVLDDGVRVIDGSQLGPYRHAGWQQEAYFSSCWLCVPIASLFKSGSRSQRDRVSLAPRMRHLMQVPRYGLLHVCTDNSSLSDGHRHRRLVAGRGCAAHFEAERSFHVLELSNWSLRQDSANLAKHVAYLRREHKRARADLQLADQDTIKHSTKGCCALWDVAFVSALRRNIKSGMGATVLTGLLQIDVCQQSTGLLGNSG